MERIGIIGGSGLYDIEGIKNLKKIAVATPFGKPSDKYITGKLNGREVVFLPRHGIGHRVNPSQINYRANIYGMKKLGVGKIISVSACGSLKEGIKPMDFVLPDQFIDRTNQARCQTFFEGGIVAHISFAHPTCACLAAKIAHAGKKTGVTLHGSGTYINMEGPQFSTLAESNLYRSWGASVIGMTNMSEARLAREAEICYVTIAAVTDYDCWYPQHDSVTVEMILNNLNNNVGNAKKIIKATLPLLEDKCSCGCKDALKYSIITNGKIIPEETKKKLKVIIGKYVK